VEHLLGEGGMGAVYKATELTLEIPVALKVLHPELVAHPTARRRMEAEARAMARIDSPHVVRIRTVFDEGGLLVLDLEYLSGGSLAIAAGGVDEATARGWMAEVLEGLAAIHEAGLVHRDIKPANVLLSAKGRLKVTDLGIAHDESRTQGTRTRLGARMGTPEYMAPEQIDGQPVDVRADVYSAGVMLYQILTGRCPYEGDEFDILYGHKKLKPDLEPVRAKSPTLALVVERALAKDPGARFGSMAEMAAAMVAPVVTAPTIVLPTQIIADRVAVAAAPPIQLVPQPEATTPAVPPAAGVPALSVQVRPNAMQYLSLGVVSVQLGTFVMGRRLELDGSRRVEWELQERQVFLGRKYAIGVAPVTQLVYADVVGIQRADSRAAQHPVENVSWLDAVAFCNALSRLHQLPEVYEIIGNSVRWADTGLPGWRLPTEAEWEYACWAGRETLTEDDVRAQAWFGSRLGGTRPVMTRLPNPWGIHDMLGNVQEWVWDWHAPLASGLLANPSGPRSGAQRVMKGGSWVNDDLASVQPAARTSDRPSVRFNNVGFRIARTLP
jgi:formylglycine-generating enzyme required for sulfatase activity